MTDEQYWVELAADKPLATTARSAQGAPAARPRGEDTAADGAGGRAILPPGPGAAHGVTRAAHPSPAPVFQAPDTDPGTRVLAGWPGADGGDARTAAWAASPTGADASGPAGREASAPTWEAQESPTAAWASPDAATGPAAEPAVAAWPGGNASAAQPDWGIEDPLTSPSYSVQRGYAADGRTSYRDPHDRAHAQHGSPGAGLAGGAPGYDGPYDSGDGGWPEPGEAYSHDRLEPLPEPPVPAPRAATGTWHPAAAVADEHFSYAGQTPGDWDQRSYDEPRYPDDAQYQVAGYGYRDEYHGPGPHDSYDHSGPYDSYDGPGPHDSYDASGPHGWNGADHLGWQVPARDWPEADPGYGRGDGYRLPTGHDHGGDYALGPGQHDQAGYAPPSRRSGPDAGYGQAGYAQPGRSSSPEAGYGQAGMNGIGHGAAGYRQAARDLGHGYRGRYRREPGPGYSPGYDIGRN